MSQVPSNIQQFPPITRRSLPPLTLSRGRGGGVSLPPIQPTQLSTPPTQPPLQTTPTFDSNVGVNVGAGLVSQGPVNVTLPTIIPKRSERRLEPLIRGPRLSSIKPESAVSEGICQICLDKRMQNVQYLNTYFGQRNGITIKPIENRNYTPETLAYMSSASFSSKVNQLINDRVGPDAYSVIECCAGIGGDTMGFLDNPQVSKVISFEQDPNRRIMLKNNLEDYRFPPERYEIRGAFGGVPPGYEGGVLYFDPPWIKQEDAVDNLKPICTCNLQYLTEGITVSDRTLEQWIEASYGKVGMIVLKLPPNYKLKPSDKYQYKSLNWKDKIKVIILTPREYIQEPITNLPTLSRDNIGISAQTPIQRMDILGPKSRVQPERLQGRVSMEPPSQPNLFQTNPDLWLKEFQQQIYSVIAPMAIPFASDPDSSTPATSIDVHRKTFVNDAAMDIWRAAFTHKTYNPNIGKNYETLELIGDRVLSGIFAKYLIRKYPDITESDLSQLNTAYMSKSKQAEISEQLGLDKWLRTLFEVIIGDKEDLFESLFGAVFQIGDNVIGSECGALLAYNLLVSIFSDIEIDLDKIKGSAKTQVKEIFEKLKWGTLEEMEASTRLHGGKWRLVLRFTDEARRLIMEDPIMKRMIGGLNLNLPLADVTEFSKAAVELNAYTTALNKLEQIGFTDEFASERSRLIREQQLGDLWTRSMMKAQRSRFKDLEISTGQAGRFKYIQLIGVGPDGTKYVLMTMKRPSDEQFINMQRDLLEQYIRTL